MDTSEVAQTYFDAWDRRDPAAIVSAFTDRGTYRDPATERAVTGGAIVDDDRRQAEQTTRRPVLALPMKPDGFIGLLARRVGHRLYTVTAWERPDQPRQLVREGAHKTASQRFLGGGFGQAGQFGVW